MPDPSTNVVVIMSDQHRAGTTGCYGHDQVETPAIDGLADNGVCFENAFCTSPLCGPSRDSFLTGTYPHTNGSITHPNDRHRSGRTYRPQIREGIESLVGRLSDSGYRTHASGYVGSHFFRGDEELGRDPDFLGYDSWEMDYEEYEETVGEDVCRDYRLADIEGEMWEPGYFNVDGEPFPHDPDEMFDRQIAANACDFLEERGSDDPFFLYVGFRATHPPWRAPPTFHDMYDPADIDDLPEWTDPPIDGKPRRVVERHQYFDIPEYSEEMVRNSLAAYYGFVSYLDDCVGRVLDTLEAIGERENTLVVYTSDHGENLYRHGLCEKHTFYEDAIRIPLVFSAPDTLPTGTRTDSLASIMDVMPTVLSLTDTPVPEWVEGRDLRQACYGDSVRDHVAIEYYHTLDPSRMIRDHRYKYVHTVDDVNELYDLENDPDERINLAWYPAYADLVEEMNERVLEDWEIPDVPIWAQWADLNERKQRQRLAGLDITDARPEPPEWVREGPAGDD
jgi:choline-sulfatase